MKKIIILAVGFLAAITLMACTNNDDNTLNIYTSRDYDVDKEIIENFTEDTGIKVNVLEQKSAELVTKLSQEKSATPADIVFITGAEYISKVDDLGLLQNHNMDVSDIMDEKYYNDKFIAVTSRARILVRDNNFTQEVITYDDIVKDTFTGKILARSSSNTYNQAMIASFVQQHGEEYTATWIENFVSKLGRTPSGNDRDQVKAVVSGEGDIALVNSYYMHKLANSTEDAEKEVESKVTAYTLTNVHENISWVGKIKDSENATKFIEYVTNKSNQEKYMNQNGEYPVHKEVVLSGYLAGLPQYEYQTINFSTLGNYTTKAYEIMLDNGWN